jgi:hypothetical protein
MKSDLCKRGDIWWKWPDWRGATVHQTATCYWLVECGCVFFFVLMIMIMMSTLDLTNTLNWIFIVLAHRNNSPQVDMSLPSDTCRYHQTHVTTIRHMSLPSDTCYYHQTHVATIRHMSLPSDTCHYHQTHVATIRHMSLPSDTCRYHQTHYPDSEPNKSLL